VFIKNTIKNWEENKGRFSGCKKEYLKQYYDINKENVCEKGKQYRVNNNEKIKEREITYRETRKDIRKEKKKKTTTCECGCEITKINLKDFKVQKVILN
jgi:predicted metalloprotease